MKHQKKDLLFLCQFFYPETNSSSTLPFDTARYMASQGLSVDALVGYPKEFTAHRHLPLTETIEGVEIRRIRYLHLNRKSRLGRLINYFSFTLGVWMNFSRLKRYRAVMVYSNPPVLPIVAIRAKRKYGTRFFYVSYDVYPEVAYATKSLAPGSCLSRVMDWINARLFRCADGVVALTDEMRAYLLAHRAGLSPDRVFTIPNWAHEKALEAYPEGDARFGFRDDQFVVSYFGNMGICQDMETLLAAAELLKDDDRIGFLIAGYGSKWGAVEARIRTRGLKNVRLIRYLVGEDFRQALARSSCYIVSLERGLTGLVAPSKYYSYLQGGRPVIAIVEKQSYLFEEVERERIGRSVNIGDGQGLCDAITAMAEAPKACTRMGQRARVLYEEKYSYTLAMAQYHALITDRCGLTQKDHHE